MAFSADIVAALKTSLSDAHSPEDYEHLVKKVDDMIAELVQLLAAYGADVTTVNPNAAAVSPLGEWLRARRSYVTPLHYIEGMSGAEVAVGARQLARSWFAMRAGGGRGMCDSAVPP